MQVEIKVNQLLLLNQTLKLQNVSWVRLKHYGQRSKRSMKRVVLITLLFNQTHLLAYLLVQQVEQLRQLHKQLRRKAVDHVVQDVVVTKTCLFGFGQTTSFNKIISFFLF